MNVCMWYVYECLCVGGHGVCACVRMCSVEVCVYTCVQVLVEARGQPWALFLRHCLH